MKKKLTENWLLKLASLVFAICLWLIVMNYENPIVPQTFTNIPVKFENAEILTDKGMVYEVLENTGVLRSVTVYGPRKTVEQLKEDDILVKADFNKLTNVNTIPLDFSTSRFNSEITRMRGSVANVKLNIEKEKTIRLVLRVNAVGKTADGYLLGNMVPDQNQIIITGPESIINTIYSAEAEVDVTDATAGIATYADVKLYDKEKNQIESDAVTQKVTSVRVAVEVLATKHVPLYYSVMGTPADGYMATGEIESTPAMVEIAGNNSVLNTINRIEIPAEELNITGQSENMMTIVNVKEYLPGNVILADGNFNGRAAVTVYIEPVVMKTVRIEGEQLSVNGVPEGFEAVIEGPDKEFELQLSGLADVVNQVNERDISGFVDMHEVQRQEDIETWKEGIYHATLQFQLPEGIRTTQTIKVKVHLEKLAE